MAATTGFPHLRDVPDIVEISPPRGNSKNKDGLQEAHIQGKDFWEKNLRPLIKTIDPDGLFEAGGRPGRPDWHPSNAVHAPESEMGGRSLGTWVHFSGQLTEYDVLHYTPGQAGENSEQFLNRLQRDTRDRVAELKLDLADPDNAAPDRQAEIKQQIADVQQDARIKFAAYNDFVATHGLHRSVLEKYDSKYGRELITLEFNELGAQAKTEALDGKTVQAYLGSDKVRSYFEYDNVTSHSMFERMVEMRTARVGTGQDPLGDMSRELIEEIPDTARQRFPLDGKGAGWSVECNEQFIPLALSIRKDSGFGNVLSYAI